MIPRVNGPTSTVDEIEAVKWISIATIKDSEVYAEWQHGEYVWTLNETKWH